MFKNAIKHFKKTDPTLHLLTKSVEPFELELHKKPFIRLLRSIIGQQLSVKAASTIFARVEQLFGKNEIKPEVSWNQTAKKSLNKLINTLVNDLYKAEGKTTFKEEFVTCGGVLLDEVSFETMESKIMPGIYFAGEVLDVDAVTGGFNFQNAWTTGYIAGKLKSIS